jgi:hydrogenase nickel incorporation protein HypA/HybF
MVPSYIEEAYPAAVYQTSFENTQLELEIIPGVARCSSCTAEFNAFENHFKCPDCGGKEIVPLSGREFIIKEIHAY